MQKERRFKPPGSIVDCTYEGSMGYGVVLSTSRHVAKITYDEAVSILADVVLDHFGWDPNLPHYRHEAIDVCSLIIRDNEKPYFWRSVTKKEIDEDTHEECGCDSECEPGSWCSGGSGSDFMEVLCTGLSEVFEEELDVLHGGIPDD